MVEFGNDQTKKFISIREQLKENELWHKIRLAAQANPTLQEALDHGELIYKLSKEYKNV